MNPLVSIIIPTFNRVSVLSDAVKSVQAQSYPHWELIVIDDGSKDSTQELLRKFELNDKRIHYYIRPKSSIKGANTCRNIGLKKSKGTFVKFLDSDDILHEKCLEKQWQHLKKTEADVSICYANFFIKSNKGINFQKELWSEELDSENLIFDLSSGKVRWQTATGLWRKAILPVNPFKEGLMNSQEWLFHIKMVLKKIEIVTLNEVLCHIRKHQDSMSDGSKKNSNYYYNASLARYFAIQEISVSKRINSAKTKIFLFKRFAWYHFFVLYRGGITNFLKLIVYYPKCIFKMIF